ncbi:MAG: acyltransferase [Bacteroidales bacterium]|jgi:acetyltransferase-like isoleucine patch superfamily enzyme|nr:acyltransferase [Bacteroidales bacterium]
MFGILTGIRSYFNIRSSLVNLSNAKFKYDIIGKNNMIMIGRGCRVVKPVIRIRGTNNKIVFENNIYIGKGCSFWLEGNNIEIIIGKDSSFTHSVHFCAQEDNTSIRIGEDCMFSNTIVVRTSDSHPIYDKISNKRINPAKSVVLGNHVWVAPNTKIMKGAIIGSGSIIGSNTIANREYPENSLIVGMPGKVVKTDIYWTREKLF